MSGWRSDESWTQGASGEKRHWSQVEHDAFGNPSVTKAKLSGTLDLFRYHEDMAPVAPQPTTGSQDGVITLSAVTRDVFGHAVLEVTAGKRCHFIAYDATFLVAGLAAFPELAVD